MRKTNWIVMTVLVIALISFLAVWLIFGFELTEYSSYLGLTIIWWLVIIAICVTIALVENKRRRSRRTVFLASNIVYNPEVGMVRISEGQAYIPIIQDILDNLEYGYKKKDIANNKRIRFKYIVRTDKFTSNGNVWTGEVISASNPEDVRYFRSAAELSALIDMG